MPNVIYTTREGLRCQEVWHDEPISRAHVDIIVRHQAIQPTAGTHSRPFETLLIDISRTPAEILSSFKPNTRRQIRQAQRDATLEVEVVDTPSTEQLQEFVDFYNRFACSKSIWPVWPPRLAAHREAGTLILSRVMRARKTLVWHAGIRSGSRYVVAYSGSCFRDADAELRHVIARSNRLLHFQEMVVLGSDGFDTYDFCGWYSGTTDHGLLMINRFKAEFRGRRVIEYNVSVDLTLRAKATRVVKRCLLLILRERPPSLAYVLTPRGVVP